MRKSSLYLLASVLITLLLGVLLFNSIQLSDFDSSLNVNKQAQTELVFANWEYMPDEIFELFNKEYPDISINFQHYNDAAYSDILRQKMTMGEKLDVIGVKTGDYRRYISQSWLLDISDEAFVGEYMPEITAAVKQAGDGRLYAVSYKAEYYGIWYNKILFEKYHLDVPKNYTEFLQVCAELKSNDIDPIVLGARDQDVAAYIYYLRAFDMMDQPGWQAAIQPNSIGGELALGLFQDTQFLVQQGYISPDSVHLTYQQAFDYFKNAKAAMLIAPDVSFNMAKEDFEKVCDPGVFAIPYANIAEQIKVPVNYLSMLVGINSQSENVEEARLFLDFLSRPEIAKIYCEQTISFPTVSGADTSSLKYNDLWMPLRSQTQQLTPIALLSPEVEASFSAAAKQFVAGLTDAAQMTEVFNSTFSH